MRLAADRSHDRPSVPQQPDSRRSDQPAGARPAPVLSSTESVRRHPQLPLFAHDGLDEHIGQRPRAAQLQRQGRRWERRRARRGRRRGGGGGRGATRQSNAGRAGRGTASCWSRATNVNMNPRCSISARTAISSTSSRRSAGRPTEHDARRAGHLQRAARRGRSTSSASPYNHSSSATTNHFGGVIDVSNLIGIQGVSQDPFAWGLPRIAVLEHHRPERRDAVASDRQPHSARSTAGRGRSAGTRCELGGDFRYDVTTTNNETNANGAFVFTGLYTTNGGNHAADRPGSTSPTSCSGCRSRRRLPYGPGETTLTGRSLGLFVQDDWRARGRT